MNKAELIKYIANRYGKEAQLMMLMEECAELIQASSKQLRRKDKSINHLIEELADVRIMIEQIEYLYWIKNLVEDEMIFKLNRQLERMKS